MARSAAIRVALDLAFTPVLTALAAKQPLPPEMLTVIKIAGGCTETLQEAATATGELPEKIRDAAASFLKAVLFTPTADSYRVLGTERSASHAELRDHMRWLMKWLHPDHERSEWESSLALRVSSAWDDLKSPERRTSYDAMHPQPQPILQRPSSGQRQRRTRIPWIAQPSNAPKHRYRIFVATVLLLLGAAGLVMWQVAGSPVSDTFTGNVAATGS
jgi:hypothetical protein